MVLGGVWQLCCVVNDHSQPFPRDPRKIMGTALQAHKRDDEIGAFKMFCCVRQLVRRVWNPSSEEKQLA